MQILNIQIRGGPKLRPSSALEQRAKAARYAAVLKLMASRLESGATNGRFEVGDLVGEIEFGED